MQMRPVATLMLGLVFAGGAVFLVSKEMNRQAQTQVQAPTPEPTIELADVVVATNPLKFGNNIQRQHLSVVSWPKESVPQGAFSDIDEILGEDAPPRSALDKIGQGEPVLRTKVSGFGDRASLSVRIPDGKRAFAIRVDAVSGVAGFLLPGDRVDVMLTQNSREAKGPPVNHVVLQNVMVRGIDQIADEDRNKPQVVRTVTLEVTPEEAQKLALASEVGSLSLSLRNMHSAEKVETRTISVADLQDALPKAKKKRVYRPAPPPSVRVRRGSEVSVVPVRGK